MGRKPNKKTKKEGASPYPAPLQVGSVQGKRMMGLGGMLLLCGFFVLSWSDPLGRNWASFFSPILILGGYLLIALGIIWPESSDKKPI